MSFKTKELCPRCINLTEVSKEKKVIREDEICFVEKETSYCQCCNFELTNTVTLKFKHRMG